eukprot:m51a1_g7270 hypothetical protein (232) ;mRNA; f:213654-214530
MAQQQPRSPAAHRIVVPRLRPGDEALTAASGRFGSRALEAAYAQQRLHSCLGDRHHVFLAAQALTTAACLALTSVDPFARDQRAASAFWSAGIAMMALQWSYALARPLLDVSWTPVLHEALCVGCASCMAACSWYLNAFCERGPVSVLPVAASVVIVAAFVSAGSVAWPRSSAAALASMALHAGALLLAGDGECAVGLGTGALALVLFGSWANRRSRAAFVAQVKRLSHSD